MLAIFVIHFCVSLYFVIPISKVILYFQGEYGSSGPGAKGPRVKWAHTLKPKDLKDYTFEKVMYQPQDGIVWNPYDNR